MSFNRQTGRRLHEDHEATLALWNRFEQTAGARAGSELADLARSCAVALAHEISRHFAFEEEELFPRLAEAGEGDIAELLTEEHVVIRSAAQAFSAALEKQDWQQLRAAGECSGRVATAGFCLGGKLAYLVGTRGTADCSVSYYGVGIEAHLDEAAKLGKPLLMHIGESDPWTPEAVRARLRDALGANPLVTMHLYPDTGHAFAREGAATDVPAMRELANLRTRAFLEANLR